MYLEPTRTAILRRTRGTTWDTLPLTERKGFVKIWVNNRGKVHYQKWVKVADLDGRSEKIKLYQPLTLVVPEKKERLNLSSSLQAVAA